MRKILLLILILFCTTGCTNEHEDQTDLLMQKYILNYFDVLDNSSYVSYSNFYNLEIVMNKLDDGYRYDIIIDNPNIAMYDIDVFAVENNIEFSYENKLMPSIGVLDNEEYNMIPNQVNIEEGFMKGIIIGGLVDEPTVDLLIKVSWKDYAKLKQYNEYFEVSAFHSDYQPIHEATDETTEESEDTQDEGE